MGKYSSDQENNNTVQYLKQASHFLQEIGTNFKKYHYGKKYCCPKIQTFYFI